MNKNKTIYSLLVVVGFLVGACSPKLQTYILSEDYATTLHYEGVDSESKAAVEEEQSDLVGIPANTFYGGDLKRGGIWWAGAGIFLEKGDEFVFEADSIGPNNTPFGATFPPIDLLVVPVLLKITARMESESSDTLALYLQVDDASGYKANANRPVNKIGKSSEYQDYYFDLRNIYAQVDPVKHKVNGKMINSLKFFINPGQSSFTGKLFIKEIKIVPAGA